MLGGYRVKILLLKDPVWVFWLWVFFFFLRMFTVFDLLCLTIQEQWSLKKCRLKSLQIVGVIDTKQVKIVNSEVFLQILHLIR